MKNSLDTAKEEGKTEGKIEVAMNLLRTRVDKELIIKSTGLTEQEITSFMM